MGHKHCSTKGCHEHHHGSCGSGHEGCCHSGCCCKQQQSCGEHQQGCEFTQHLLELADEAWMEVLKEKIKKQVEGLSGAHLDQLAKLVAEANHKRWKHKMGTNQACSEFSDKVSEILNHH